MQFHHHLTKLANCHGVMVSTPYWYLHLVIDLLLTVNSVTDSVLVFCATFVLITKRINEGKVRCQCSFKHCWKFWTISSSMFFFNSLFSGNYLNFYRMKIITALDSKFQIASIFKAVYMGMKELRSMKLCTCAHLHEGRVTTSTKRLLFRHLHITSLKYYQHF